MSHSTSQFAYWKRAVFALLLLAPRAVWITCVIIGALAISGMAYAGGSCPRVLSRTADGTTVVITEGCQLDSVARMFPQIDPTTGTPYPMQVQLRSIYAANQNYVEADGNLRRRTVLRTCAKPGKPDPFADTEEKTVCPKGLMYYFGVASDGGQAKIFIPSQRVLTPAESAEKAERETAAADAVKAKAREEKQIAEDAHARVEVDAQSAVTIKLLQKDLAESQQITAALKGPASKGRWFWGLVVCMLGLAAWGVGGTMSTIRARQVKPVIATGRFFASDEVASQVLSEESLRVQIENDKLRTELKATRKAQADESKKFIARVQSLEGSVSERVLLAELRLKERDEAREERDTARQEFDRVQNTAISLRQERDRLTAEAKSLKSDVGGLCALNEMLEAEKSQLQTQVNQLSDSDRELQKLRSDNNGLRALKEMLEAEKSQLQAQVNRLATAEKERKRLADEAVDLEEIVSTLRGVQSGQAKQLQEAHADLVVERAHVEQLEQEKRELMQERDLAVVSQQAAQSRLNGAMLRDFDNEEVEALAADFSEEPTRVRKDTVPFGLRHLVPSSANSLDAMVSSVIPPYVGQSPASSAYRKQTANGLAAVNLEDSPEERFAALYDEIRSLRTERNVYAQGIGEIKTLVFGDPVPSALDELGPIDLVRLLVDDITEVYRQGGRLFVRGATAPLR